MKQLLSLYILLTIGIGYGQSFKTNGGFLLKAQIRLGNQNQGVKIGAYAIGAAHYGDAAIEGGVALYSGYLFKRHTAKTSGFNFGYDVFSLIGIGKNTNLLASSFFADTPLLFSEERDQKFYGLGFGFEKEYLPHNLSLFDQKIGKILLRFANANHSINTQFKNDFRFGKIFNGDGTDFGNTGMFQVSYSEHRNPQEAIHLGFGLKLFTPEADYSKTPNNPTNSDDGSRNVWYTKGDYTRLFYANVYGFGSYQDDGVFALAKAGVNSQKAGAFIQNTLHDSFGLNPRYPWDVAANDILFIETGGSLFIPESND
jgi:hypothetical protein